MEYAIWGKSPQSLNLNETLLLTAIEGEPITRREDAEHYAKVLREKYHCTDVRIQELDFANPTIFS